jgi:endonuclease/exonuclease/phosphatase family metal-dependent hydrolase
VRVVTWNLFHGRAVPPAGRELLSEFAAALARWPWDVALLQEVPPWWPAPLARACNADQRHALTARNQLLPLRRLLAERWPDAMKAQGGGANAILVRGAAIAEHRALVLRRWPERRVAHGVRLAGGAWTVNLHASAHVAARAQADVDRARAAALEWAGGGALVLGGDLNLRRPRVEGLAHVAGRDVDHVFTRGLRRSVPATVLDRGTLSDHAPLAVSLTR